MSGTTMGVMACVACVVLCVCVCCVLSSAFGQQAIDAEAAISGARGKPYVQVANEVHSGIMRYGLTIQVVRKGAGQTLTAGDNTLVLVVDANDRVTDAILADEDAVKTVGHAGVVATYRPVET